jgi:hypothetical protein
MLRQLVFRKTPFTGVSHAALLFLHPYVNSHRAPSIYDLVQWVGSHAKLRIATYSVGLGTAIRRLKAVKKLGVRFGELTHSRTGRCSFDQSLTVNN